MPRTKYTNPVLARNGGLDSTRTLRLLEQVLTTHDLKQPVLYQFILTGSDHKPTYQSAIKALMKHIRTKCRAEYIGGYEVGEEKGGLHAHMYVVIETAHHFPSDLLDVREGRFLARLISRKNKGTDPATDKQFGIRIEPPKNAMHGGQMFARLNTADKLVDAIKWASYFLKPRSKDAVPGRETYFGSEFTSNITKREAQRHKHRAALAKSSAPAPAPQDPKEPTMTPAQTYVASHYEAAVDRGLDLEAFRLYLLAHGIKRTPAQVLHELDEVYGFYGYSASHPAPDKPDAASFDKATDQMKDSEVKRLAVLEVGVYNCLTDVRHSYTPRSTA